MKNIFIFSKLFWRFLGKNFNKFDLRFYVLYVGNKRSLTLYNSTFLFPSTMNSLYGYLFVVAFTYWVVRKVVLVWKK